MIEVIGVRFKSVGKIYYFDPNGQKFAKGDHAIVETVRGLEIGEIMLANRDVPEEAVVMPLKQVIRVATKADFDKLAENTRKEKEAFELCNKKIKEHKLDMKLIEVEYTFDGNKILFYFTADGRVDFRDLVKSLATVFRTRIELRQIGVRDEAKMLGGVGICGRPLCCRTFLGEFEPVSIKMAKEQNLSLNPTKISGTCGRLMCCLKYEQENYEEMLKFVPKADAVVRTPDGKGVVIDNNVLGGTVRVRLDNPENNILHTYKAKDLVIIRDAPVRLTQEEIAKLKQLEDK